MEHWANALHGGPAATQAMLGHPVIRDQLPYFGPQVINVQRAAA